MGKHKYWDDEYYYEPKKKKKKHKKKNKKKLKKKHMVKEFTKKLNDNISVDTRVNLDVTDTFLIDCYDKVTGALKKISVIKKLSEERNKK